MLYIIFIEMVLHYPILGHEMMPAATIQWLRKDKRAFNILYLFIEMVLGHELMPATVLQCYDWERIWDIIHDIYNFHWNGIAIPNIGTWDDACCHNAMIERGYESISFSLKWYYLGMRWCLLVVNLPQWLRFFTSLFFVSAVQTDSGHDMRWRGHNYSEIQLLVQLFNIGIIGEFSLSWQFVKENC